MNSPKLFITYVISAIQVEEEIVSSPALAILVRASPVDSPNFCTV